MTQWKIPDRRRGEKDFCSWHYLWKTEVKYRQRRDGWMEVGERGMEWDRKWKAFSGFTPCDLISVIMGFMSFPSRRPHTTSHVPGHTHSVTHTSGPIFHSLAQRQTHGTCVFVSLSVHFLTLSLSRFHIVNHTPSCSKSWDSLKGSDIQILTVKEKCLKVWGTLN